MEWTKWEPTYLDIVRRLSLDSSMDRAATTLLTELLLKVNPSPLLHLLEERIRNRSVVVCGAGPSLEKHLHTLEEREDYQNLVLVAADGAVSLLLEQDQKCDVIVTDLDGDHIDIRDATRDGALTIVHGHGDNMDKVQDVVPELGLVLGSTQVEPTERAFLWGGFTDGDRACYVVTSYNPREVILAGMDFGDIVGKWSKPSHNEHFLAPERKRIKLKIAHELVTTLFEESDIPHTIL